MTENPTALETQTAASDGEEDTALAPEAVRAFLKQNPDFFEAYPDLVKDLQLPSRFGR